MKINCAATPHGGGNLPPRVSRIAPEDGKHKGGSSHHKKRSAIDVPEIDGIPQQVREEAMHKIRRSWMTITEGLIRAAERGNVRAFLAMREEAWGDPFPGRKAAQPMTEISFEELLPTHESGSRSRNQRATATKLEGGSMVFEPKLSPASVADCKCQTSANSLAEPFQIRPSCSSFVETAVGSDESSLIQESEPPCTGDKVRRYGRRIIEPVNSRHADVPEHLQVPKSSFQSTSQSIEVDFRELADGRRLEVLEDPEDSTRTRLAVFHGGEVYLASRVDYGGQVLVPVARNSDGLEDIVLPRAPNRYRSPEDLLSRTVDIVKACVSLRQPYLDIVAAFVLYSWFADRLRPPVYLLVTGVPQSGKTTLLEVMRLLCRRSLLVGDITAAAAYDVCSRFHPTLLVDENEWRADSQNRTFRKHLRVGTSGNLLVKHLRKTQNAFGAKILSSHELPDDPALRSRCVHIPMFETDQLDLHKPWDPSIVEAAGALRGALLQFRLEQYGSIFWRLVPGAERLRPRSRDLLGSLVAPLPNECAMEKMIGEHFYNVHDPGTRQLLSPTQHAVVAALFQFIHLCPNEQYVQVAKIAELANESLRAAGERFTLTPRKISGLLESLGFTDRVRSSRGSFRYLDQKASRRIHRLARAHNVSLIERPGLLESVRKCNICTAMNAETSTQVRS